MAADFPLPAPPQFQRPGLDVMPAGGLFPPGQVLAFTLVFGNPGGVGAR
jgi:hypothetical protein